MFAGIFLSGIIFGTVSLFGAACSIILPIQQDFIMSEKSSTKSDVWSGRFSEPVDELVQRYTASVTFDKRMAAFDIQGSLAHAEMLCAQKIISPRDLADIMRGLKQISEEIAEGSFDWQIALEDVHMNIERRLTDLIGDAGKRLHTGRSRNDQVATDIRLYLRSAIDDIDHLLHRLCESLLNLAEKHFDTILPGFTHMQVAQPVTFGHHLLAYAEMFNRDIERLRDCRKRVNRLPLGAAALAGTTFPIDRERVAKTLEFEEVCRNSLDAVSDRDFAIEFCADAALIMTHISRMSEELIIWMSPRVGFIDIADRFCTGSSIMPQKKKPRCARTGKRQNRSRQRSSDRAADADERPATGVQQGQSGRQGTAFRYGRYSIRYLAYFCGYGQRNYGQTGNDASGSISGICHRNRSGRLSGQKRASFP